MITKIELDFNIYGEVAGIPREIMDLVGFAHKVWKEGGYKRKPIPLRTKSVLKEIGVEGMLVRERELLYRGGGGGEKDSGEEEVWSSGDSESDDEPLEAEMEDSKPVAKFKY